MPLEAQGSCNGLHKPQSGSDYTNWYTDLRSWKIQASEHRRPVVEEWRSSLPLPQVTRERKCIAILKDILFHQKLKLQRITWYSLLRDLSEIMKLFWWGNVFLFGTQVKTKPHISVNFSNYQIIQHIILSRCSAVQGPLISKFFRSSCDFPKDQAIWELESHFQRQQVYRSLTTLIYKAMMWFAT